MTEKPMPETPDVPVTAKEVAATMMPPPVAESQELTVQETVTPAETVVQPETKAPEPPKVYAKAELRYLDAVFFRKVLELVDTINSEPNFTFSKDAVELSMMDPSRCVLLRIKLPKEIFETYQPATEQEQPVAFAFDLSRVLTKIKSTSVQKGDNLVLRVDLTPEKPSKGTFRDNPHGKLFVSVVGPKVKKTWDFSLLDQEDAEKWTAVPAVTHATKLIVDMDALSQLFADMGSGQGIHFTVSVKDETLKLEEDLDGEAGLTSTFKKGEGMEIESAEDTSAWFSSSNSQELVKKLKPLADRVRLNLRTDMPVKIEAVDEQYEIELWMAPQIRDNDNT